MNVLLYVNQVYWDEVAGQGSFERGVAHALIHKVNRDPNKRMIRFTVKRPHDRTRSDRYTLFLDLDKGSYLSYLAHQFRLLWALSAAVWRERRHNVTVFIRYNPAMIAPALVTWGLRPKLVMRTGPILPGIVQHARRNNPLVLYCVRILLGFHYALATKIIVATRRIGQWVAETYPTVAHKLMIVCNGVDPDRFSPVPPCRTKWGLPNTGVVMGYTGTLAELQGIRTVLLAMAKLCATGQTIPHFLIVGDGPDEESFRELARELRLDSHVVFAGRRRPEEIPSAICSCDFMLLPSHNSTLQVRGTSAIKLFEYLSCDRFVLGSRCDDLAFLEQHQIGRLVEAENVDHWAVAIAETTQLGNHDMAGRARDLVVQHHTFDVVAEQIWSACFDQTVGKRPSTPVPQAGGRA